jgi:hypothetical protein
MELKNMALDTFTSDSEQGFTRNVHLKNTTVTKFIWQDVTVTVQDRVTKKPKAILDQVEGIVSAGLIPFHPLEPEICILTCALLRRDVCFDGPQWIWKDYSFKLPSQTRQLWS